jgi:hypothetical protein
MKLLVGLVLLLPLTGRAISTAPQILCDVPNPCGGIKEREVPSCAAAKADWIVEGHYSIIGGVHTVEQARPLKGQPPLLESKNGKFLIWRSCWGVTAEPWNSIRAYGDAQRGIFLAVPPPPVRDHSRPNIP